MKPPEGARGWPNSCLSEYWGSWSRQKLFLFKSWPAGPQQSRLDSLFSWTKHSEHLETLALQWESGPNRCCATKRRYTPRSGVNDEISMRKTSSISSILRMSSKSLGFVIQPSWVCMARVLLNRLIKRQRSVVGCELLNGNPRRRNSFVNKTTGALLLMICFFASQAMALPPPPPAAPEIDPGSISTAVAFLCGVGLMLRGRRKA